MGNKIRFSYAENFRETILLMTVFYVMLPMDEIGATTVDITWLVIQFLLFGCFLLQIARMVAKDTMLFPWDKVLFFVSLLMEGGLIAARPFVELPDVLSWITLVWACTMMIMGVALVGVVYPTLDKKGKWKSPISAEEAGGMAVSSYLTMAISLLTINHVIFYL